MWPKQVYQQKASSNIFRPKQGTMLNSNTHMKHLEVPMRTALPSKLLKKVTKLENQSDITARKGNSNIFKKAPLRLRN